jgi:hypothetical protein
LLLNSSQSNSGHSVLVLAVLDARNLLFSESEQSLYELDDFSAYVWRSLDSGLSPEQIAGEVIEAGTDIEAAEKAVAAAVRTLRTIECRPAAPSVPPISSSKECLERITLALAGAAVQINLAPPLRAEVETVLGHLGSDVTWSHVQLSAHEADGTVEIGMPGKPPSYCRRAEFVPLIKTLLVETVLSYANYDVALHAAAVAKGSDASLLLGSPGAGKTTLATALARRGFYIASDDVVLLHNDQRLTGLALPSAIKESAWSLLSSDWPQLQSQAIYYRPDGVRVRYLRHEQRTEGALSIRNVISLDRQADAPASLQEVGAISILEALISEGDAPDGRLSESAFRSLVGVLRGARCFRLKYSAFEDAVEVLTADCL